MAVQTRKQSNKTKQAVARLLASLLLLLLLASGLFLTYCINVNGVSKLAGDFKFEVTPVAVTHPIDEHEIYEQISPFFDSVSDMSGFKYRGLDEYSGLGGAKDNRSLPFTQYGSEMETPAPKYFIDDTNQYATDGQYLYMVNQDTTLFGAPFVDVFSMSGNVSSEIAQIPLNLIPPYTASSEYSDTSALNSEFIGPEPPFWNGLEISSELEEVLNENYMHDIYSEGVREIQIEGDTLIVISGASGYGPLDGAPPVSLTRVRLFDVSNPLEPNMIYDLAQSGHCLGTQLSNGFLYLMTSHRIIQRPVENNLLTYLPFMLENGSVVSCPAENVTFMPALFDLEYAYVTSIDIENRYLADQQAVLGCSTAYSLQPGSAYLTSTYQEVDLSRPGSWQDYLKVEPKKIGYTQIVRLALDGGRVETKAICAVDGCLLNRNAISIANGYLQLVVATPNNESNFVYSSYEVDPNTRNSPKKTNYVICALDPSLNLADYIGMNTSEKQFTTARFFENACYFMECRYDDDGYLENLELLFAVDMSDPTDLSFFSAGGVPGDSFYLHHIRDGLYGSFHEVDYRIRNRNELRIYDMSEPQAITLVSKESSFERCFADYSIDGNWVGQFYYENIADGSYRLYTYDDEQGLTLLRSLYIGEADPDGPSANAHPKKYATLVVTDDWIYAYSNVYLDVYDTETLECVKSIEIIGPYSSTVPFITHIQ